MRYLWEFRGDKFNKIIIIIIPTSQKKQFYFFIKVFLQIINVAIQYYLAPSPKNFTYKYSFLTISAKFYLSGITLSETQMPAVTSQISQLCVSESIGWNGLNCLAQLS